MMMTNDLEQHADQFSATERDVWQKIRSFKNEEPGLVTRAQGAVSSRLEDVAERIGGTDSGEAIEQAVSVVLDILHDTATWTVRQPKIFEDFRDEGYDVYALDDVRALPLEAVEETLGHIDRKYSVAAFAEGAAAGAAGLPGVLADLPAVVTICLRAINEYGVYFGFDIQGADERPVAVLILAAAATMGEARAATFERIQTYTRSLDAPQEGPPEVSEAVLRQVVQDLVVRLVRGKLAETLPLVGALVGGGFNRAFVDHVCETAQRVYEQRWLVRRYEFG